MPLRATRSLATLALACAAACLAPSVARAWRANGIPVTPPAGNSGSRQTEAAIVSDGAGGAFIAWIDVRDNLVHTYLHHLDATGAEAAGWPPGGQPMLDLPWNPTLIADGEGGVYLGANESYPGRSIIRLVRVASDGSIVSPWAVNGLAIPADEDPWKAAPAVSSTAPVRGEPGDPGRSVEGAASQQVFKFDPTVFGPSLSLADDHGPLMAWLHEPAVTCCTHTHATRFTASGGTMAGLGIAGGAFEIAASPVAVCSDDANGMWVAFARASYPDSIRLIVHHIGSDGAAAPPVMACAIECFQDSPGLIRDGAGGVWVVWRDRRIFATPRPFVQHVLAGGGYAPGWPAEGVALTASATEAGTYRMLNGGYWPTAVSSVASDGAGGLYVAWTDFRGGPANGDVYAQHLLADGTRAAGWPANGLAVCSAPRAQRHPTVSEDGAGGLLVCWEDSRGASQDIYAQHIGGAGGVAPGWPVNGTAVCAADSLQELPQIASDGEGGAIVAWTDHRAGRPQTYAQRVSADGTVPVLAALAGVDANGERVRVTWMVSGASGAPIEVERASRDEAWRPIARVWPDALGRVSVEDRDVTAGGRYRYRLAFGDALRVGEVMVEVPLGAELSLRASGPNPSAGHPRIAFSLPDQGAARLQIVDVAGRTVFSRDIGSLGGGRHVIVLGDEAHLAAGFYVVRLTRGERSLTRRLLVTR
jgi:hypothetical protein